MKRIFATAFVAVLVTFAVVAQSPFNVGANLSLKRISDPQLSPDGRTVAYTMGTVDKDANRVFNHIYIVGIDGSGGKQLTSGTTPASQPRWSPDGKRLAFVTGGQIWTMKPDGSDRTQVTKISTGASGPVWSPDGNSFLFVSDVYPECTNDECNKATEDRVTNSKVKAKVAERLLFKRWDQWRDRKRTHLFIVPAKGGTARDLTPGDFDAPPYGAAHGHDYAFTPDSSTVAYLKNTDEVEAVSTNSDIFLLPLNGGAAKNVTAGMKGYDMHPEFTPDGKYMIFRSMERAGFEADRPRIMRFNMQSGEIVELTRGFDLQADEMAISSDSKMIYFTAGERGRNNIFSVPVEPDFRQRIATHVRKVVDGKFATGLNLSRDGRTFVFLSSSASAPAEVARVNVDGTGMANLTNVNRAFLDTFRLSRVEDIEWKGAMNTTNHGFIVKPSNFDASKKYPMIVLIHGGPQGAWNDTWSYRWNPQVFANAGYVVFMPNPRGSTGYGQRFVDEISGDWGGKVTIDIMNGVAAMTRMPYVDKNNIGAAGASYGGYMVNWLLGHNNDPRFKFKAFVSHAGVYNLESMATSTEEIYFVNWEFKGMPWDNPAMYNRWSPNKFAKNFKVPTLVTGGELDFRVPIDQCLQLYTTLQLRGVDSKLVVFPDEGHWILKPQNSEFWHGHVLGWFDKYLK